MNNIDDIYVAAAALDDDLSVKSDHVIEVGVDEFESKPRIYVEIDDACAKNLIPRFFKGFKIFIRLSSPARFACAC